MKRFLLALAALVLTTAIVSSCEKDERILVKATLSLQAPKISYPELQKEFTFPGVTLSDDDLYDMFEDMTKDVTPDYDSALMALEIYDEISSDFLRKESHVFVWDGGLGRYVLYTPVI